MKRRVEWARSALDDLIAQIEHIAANDPPAAEWIATAIRETGEALGDFATGHPGRVSATYEKSVRRLPYIIAYTLSENDTTVSILRVIRTARNWDDESLPE